jgi:hypothetical protein
MKNNSYVLLFFKMEYFLYQDRKITNFVSFQQQAAINNIDLVVCDIAGNSINEGEVERQFDRSWSYCYGTLAALKFLRDNLMEQNRDSRIAVYLNLDGYLLFESWDNPYDMIDHELPRLICIF